MLNNIDGDIPMTLIKKGYRKLSVIYATLITLIVLAILGAPAVAFTTLATITPLYFVALGVKYWKFKASPTANEDNP